VPQKRDLRPLLQLPLLLLCLVGFLDKSAAADSSSLESLAHNILEVRAFLTNEPTTVVGEIVVQGAPQFSEIAIELEEGLVRFRDDGQAPDKIQNDQVFTANLKLDVRSISGQLLKELRGNLQKGAAFLRRGPRDIVQDTSWRAELTRQFPQLMSYDFKQLNEERPELSHIREFSSVLNNDAENVPLYRSLGPEVFDEGGSDTNYILGIPTLNALDTSSVEWPQSLVITDLKIVEDPKRTFDACMPNSTPGGIWSFGHIVSELAHGTNITPEDFVLRWLNTWTTPQIVNDLPPVFDEQRAKAIEPLILKSWRNRSPGNKLDVNFFPARLLAIVNRPDLAEHIGLGKLSSAGEARFVFGLVDYAKDSTTGEESCQSLEFTMIFEFDVKRDTCTKVKAWQQKWKDLDQHKIDDPKYTDALESLTREFTSFGSYPEQLPNQISLKRLRTNEKALSFPWQMREFQLKQNGDAPGTLQLTTTAQTPRNELNFTETLEIFLIQFGSDILANKHNVRENFPSETAPFRGAVSDVQDSLFWSVPNEETAIKMGEVRRKFSLATCNGCHAGETLTAFTHIGDKGKRELNHPAELSSFMKGDLELHVPVTGENRIYSDIEERKKLLTELLERPCFTLLGFKRLPFVH
jgi:hypothetical protein